MHIRDKIYILIDKITKSQIRQASKIMRLSLFSEEQYKRANEFFSQFPKIDLQAEKVRCPKCNLLHKVYCLKCGELLVNKELIPKVELPVNLQQFKIFQIFQLKKLKKHQKSSAIPAKFLSDQVEVKDFPNEFEFDEHTYVLYPHQNAKYIKELSQEELQNIKKFVAIDCMNEQQSIILYVALNRSNFRENLKQISSIKIHKIRGLLNILLEIHILICSFSKQLSQIRFLILFRISYDILMIVLYQHHSLKCLATIEAIYYCYQEYSKAMNINQNYNNLLFFYKYTFQQITDSVQQEVGNSNIYQKIEQKKQRILQSKQDAKKEKLFKKL